jgi:hypothetical protein
MRKGTVFLLVFLMLGYFSWNIQVHYCADTISSIQISATEVSGCKKCIKKSACCETVSIQNHTSQFFGSKHIVQLKKQQVNIRLNQVFVSSLRYLLSENKTKWIAFEEVFTKTPIYIRNQQFRL